MLPRCLRNGLFIAIALSWTCYIPGCSDRPATSAAPARVSDSEAHPATLRFKVTGMVCEGCEQAIRDTLTRLPGVTGCEASHEKQTVIVMTTDPAIESQAIEKITGLGYKVIPESSAGG